MWWCCSDVARTWCRSIVIDAPCFLSFPCLLWYGGGAVVRHLSSPVCRASFVVPASLAARTCNPPREQWLARLEAGSFVIGPSAITRDPPHEQWLVRLDVGAVSLVPSFVWCRVGAVACLESKIEKKTLVS
jgi:hypothetical protein